MFLNFVRFNFRGTNVEAEERNYRTHYTHLAGTLPGMQLYLTGRMLEHRGVKPSHFRAALIAFDSAAAADATARSEVEAAVLAEFDARFTDVIAEAAEAELIVPFDGRKPGRECFVMVAEFNLEARAGLDAADDRYRTCHVSLASRLPKLRSYIIGCLGAGLRGAADRYRIAVLVFDSFDAFREAYRSPAGQDLRQDEATLRDARVYRLDARVEL